MHEETPVESIIGNHSMQEVFAEVAGLLSETNRDLIASTLGFVRDASLYKHPHRDAFHEYLGSSNIWHDLKRLLRARDFHVRSNAIYTIGKLTHKNRAYLLSDAFPFYLDTDPLNIPSLIHELRWLSGEWNWDFFLQIATGNHYLQRWSLCPLIDDSGSSTEVAEHFLNMVSSLENDSHPCVAAEAKLYVERIRVKLGPKLPKAEWKKEVRRIAQLEPRLTFERVRMKFMSDKTDYTFAEFDKFFEQQLKG